MRSKKCQNSRTIGIYAFELVCYSRARYIVRLVISDSDDLENAAQKTFQFHTGARFSLLSRFYHSKKR